MEFRLLKADEIEVKVKKVLENGAVALLYKTARTDMNLLDEFVGSMFWQADYKEIKENLYCGIGILDKEREEWVWKWDCGTESRDDGEGNEKKGEASDAFKRAGFKWGIGRELYTAPKFIFLNVETTESKNDKYVLKNKFASFSVKSIEYDGKDIKSVVIVDDKGKVVYGKNTEKPETPKAKSSLSELDLDMQSNGMVHAHVAKYFGVTLDKLTDEMKLKALQNKCTYKGVKLSFQELEDYRKSLEVAKFKEELKE